MSDGFFIFKVFLEVLLCHTALQYQPIFAVYSLT
jgi:hypothetical protein